MWRGRRVRNLDSESRRESNLSRRDKRNQPGVSTPGADRKMPRPVGAVEGGFCATKLRTRPETNYLPPSQGEFIGWIIPGVKTPGLVLLSLRDKSEASRRDYIFE